MLPAPSPEQLPPLIVLGTATVVLLTFHYATPARVWQWLLADRVDSAQAVVLQRSAGVLLLGIVPGLVGWWALGRSPIDLGLGVPEPTVSLGFLGFIAVAALPLVRWSAKRPDSREAYPEIRSNPWDRRLRTTNALSWAVYLLAYEFFFRGFLLVPLVAWAGLWPGIAITTAIYVTVHFTQPAGEAIGTLPMGILFALVALSSGAIWAGWIGHVAIAVANDHWVVEANPELSSA